MKEIHLSSVDSTQTYAKKNRSNDLVCISADVQTAGHGRHSRKWIAPKDVNILATFSFALKTPHLACLGHLLTASMAMVLLEEGLSPKIKWPNDIQLNDKKLCGVICETDDSHIFLGIGLNVNMEKADLDQIDQPATSLKVETGRKWDRNTLLKKLQKQFQVNQIKFVQLGFAPFHTFFESHMIYLNQPIEWSDGRKKLSGICRRLRPDGGLDLELPSGHTEPIYSGDITLI